jgi:hypothetical protein
MYQKTICSTKEFVDVWVPFIWGGGSFALRDNGGDIMHGVIMPCRPKAGECYCKIHFGPVWAPCYPEHPVSTSSLLSALTDTISSGYREIILNVRFDCGDFAAQLESMGLYYRRVDVSVVHLSKDYDKVFSKYGATRRKNIKRFYKSGATIRETKDYSDVLAFCRVLKKLESQKENFHIPDCSALYCRLIDLPESAMFVSEFEGNIIGGLIILHDGDSTFAMSTASDREYSHIFPSPALEDRGIQVACERGALTYNFGGSGTESLRFFKGLFGAVIEQNWMFSISQA